MEKWSLPVWIEADIAENDIENSIYILKYHFSTQIESSGQCAQTKAALSTQFEIETEGSIHGSQTLETGAVRKLKLSVDETLLAALPPYTAEAYSMQSAELSERKSSRRFSVRVIVRERERENSSRRAIYNRKQSVETLCNLKNSDMKLIG